MKFQRRILPPHSSTYFEMEEYTAPSVSQQSISIAGSTSDLSEIESVCSLSTNLRQRSDSLTNLFNMSEDNTSLSNLSIASYTLSQHSYDNSSPNVYSSLSTQPPSVNNTNSDRTARSRRSICSSTTSSQKNFSIKTAETVLTTIGIHPSSSDTCGLIANDGNNIENIDDHHHEYDDEENICSSSDENDMDILSSQPNRGLRKTVLNNVDRLLNSANKQIKL